MCRTVVLFVLGLLTSSGIAAAQESPVDPDDQYRLSPEERREKQELQPRIGLYGEAGLNLHTGDFPGLPEAPCCMELDSVGFGGATTFGFGAGLLFELPLTPDWLLETRAGYSSIGGQLTSDANIGPILIGESDTASGISRYKLDATLGLLEGSVTLGWRPIDQPLTIRLGPEIGLIMQKSYDQREELIEPSSASFIAADNSSTRIRNRNTGDMETTGIQFNGRLGVDYELPMNSDRTLLLVPGIRYSFPFLKIRSDVDWRVHQLRGGVAIKYSIPVPQPAAPIPPSIVPRTPPPPPAQPVLAAEIQPVGVTREGEERDILQITVEEFINTQTHALLNYIFFDENSSQIPARYEKYASNASEQFSFDLLRDQGTLNVYHHLLNIIGARMEADPGAQITLTGTNANKGQEEGNRELSRARAEAVKSYLTSKWGIEPGRIDVQARNLPRLPSNPDEADGDEENRRVEISSNRASLLEPVTTDDTLRTVDPPILRVKSSFTADAGMRDWSLQLRQGPNLLKEYSGDGDVPAEIDWNIEGDPNAIPRRQQPILALLSVRDEQGQTESAGAQLPVEQLTIRKKREERIGDIVYNRFNLITFDYNSARLSAPSKKIAREIRDVIQPESTVEIVGYSDRLGEEEHNMKLSAERAENTARELNVPVENAKGGGENTTLFDNDLPEGRFYTRTVDILIKTPVNQE